ncbi:MAG: NADH-ubiquinone oxidoreductase subunit NDUFA12 family protein [Sphingomonadaceae bacterium]
MGFNIFTWDSGSTLGTWLATRRGTEVGQDGDGNRYYESRDGAKRWVIYAVDNDSSRVPPEWHGWLHRTRKSLPTETPLPVKAWEKPWRPNPTGTAHPDLPSGALAAGGVRQPSSADYRAWTPED